MMEPIEIEIVLDVPAGTKKPEPIESLVAKAVLSILKDRDYVRDDHGRFSETGGGGGEGEGKDDDVDRGESGGRIDDDSIPDAAQDDIVPPPKGTPVHNPFIDEDKNGDGVTDAARVGIKADLVMPPPSK